MTQSRIVLEGAEWEVRVTFKPKDKVDTRQLPAVYSLRVVGQGVEQGASHCAALNLVLAEMLSRRAASAGCQSVVLYYTVQCYNLRKQS